MAFHGPHPFPGRSLGGGLQSVSLPTQRCSVKKGAGGGGGESWSQIGLLSSLSIIILEKHVSIKSTEKAFSEDTVSFWETG